MASLFLRKSTTVLRQLRAHTITDITNPNAATSAIFRHHTAPQCRPYNGFPHFFRKSRECSSEISPSLLTSAFSSSSGSSMASFSKLGLVTWYLEMVKSRPILTKSITSALIYIAADLSSQTISLPSSEPYDLVRTLRMAGYGFLVLGPTLHYWFNFMSKLFPKRDLVTTFMKSSMKANMGKLLADALGYYYFDSDGLVEEAAGGESAAKAYRESDEKGFRESETEVLKQLSSMGRLVVCAGDGAVQSSTNLALLRHGVSLWIEIPLNIIARDMIEGGGQFLAQEVASASNSEEVLTQLMATYEEMKGGYATADATISLQKVAAKLGYDGLDSVTTEDMTLEVLKEIEKLTRVKKMMEAAARPF